MEETNLTLSACILIVLIGLGASGGLFFLIDSLFSSRETIHYSEFCLRDIYQKPGNPQEYILRDAGNCFNDNTIFRLERVEN